MLPQMARYAETFPVHDGYESAELVLYKDNFVYEEFTKSFSMPIQNFVTDNGWSKTLYRVWETYNGYVVLETAVDPMDYELEIYYISSNEEKNEAFLRSRLMSGQTSTIHKVTKSFLEAD